MRGLPAWMIAGLAVLAGLLLWVGWEDRNEAGWVPFGFGILFALFGGAPAGQALSVLGLGAVALFIAVALLSPRLVPPIAGIVGYPLERLRGVAGRLARENSLRNPGRTAATASAASALCRTVSSP